MNNNFPFFRFPFYPYPHMYGKNAYHNINSKTMDNKEIYNNHISTYNEKKKNGDIPCHEKDEKNEKKSSKYLSIGPIFINTDGFSNKEAPLLEISGLKLYLDDLIILSLLFFPL